MHHPRPRLIYSKRSPLVSASSTSPTNKLPSSPVVCTRLIRKLIALERRSPSLVRYVESIVDNLLTEPHDAA